jgi:hypothetical protein
MKRAAVLFCLLAIGVSGRAGAQLPPAEPAQLQKALETQPLSYQVVPAAQMPTWDPIAFYLPSSFTNPQPQVVISQAFANLLSPYAHMPRDAQKALLYAASFDVMDAGSAGPGWKMLYLLLTSDEEDCNKCSSPYFVRETQTANAIEYLLDHNIKLKLPAVIPSPQPLSTP